MPVARVVAIDPESAEVLLEDPAGASGWRRVLAVEGVDAELRARLLGQLLEAGLVAPAAALADPAGRAVALEAVLS